MSVKIRLQQIGKREQRSYRIVASDQRSKRDGQVIEVLGSTRNRKGTEFQLRKDRVDFWLSKGAQLTDGTRKLLGQ